MLSLTLVSSLLFTVLDGAGFDYPTATMPPPKDAHYAVLVPLIQPIFGYETPMAIRYTSIIDVVSWNCVAVYHETALDAITKQRPSVVADNATINNYGDSQTRMLCIAYAAAIISVHYFNAVPDYILTANSTLTSLGLDASFITIDSDVLSCGVQDIVCLEDVAETNNYIPEVMSSIVAIQAIDYLQNDGWNADGSIGADGDVCTANCRAYSDTTGYSPSWDKRNSWKPLVEDNGKGFFFHYDHVVPHIGRTAVTKTITRKELRMNSAPKPKYKYKAEKQLVIDRLADLATNDTMKMLVEFFDNKINVALTILFQLDATLNWTLEERIQWMTGYTATEYDAIVQAWREKVKYDLIRPTTLIQADGDSLITTYGGPNKGLQQIKSKDFESYQRVMPHSEYPSGSGCLCLAATDFTDKWLEKKYGINDSISIQLPIAAGSSRIEPGNTPENDLFVTFGDLTEYSNICGESRLWGGMHFTKAVTASRILCAGLGQTGYDYGNGLL